MTSDEELAAMTPEDELGTLLFEFTVGKDNDTTPLQMISMARLGYYRRLHSAVRDLFLVLQSEPADEA